MKKFLPLICLLISLQIFAQTDTRVEIVGEIQVPLNAEAAGITVYNLTSNEGTVTNDDGEFIIEVALNDHLNISAVQYQPFIVIIDKGVITSKTLNITVREAINELDEVIVRPYDLSGNVRVDIQRVEEPFHADLISAAELQNASVNFVPDRATPVENISMDDPYMKNGLQFINIFKAIFGNNETKTRTAPQPKKNIEAHVRELYQDDFFKKYINVEKESIDEFILFAEKNGLSNELLQQGKELDLIEFLIAQGREFKQENWEEN